MDPSSSKIALADLSYNSRLSIRDYPVDMVHKAKIHSLKLQLKSKYCYCSVDMVPSSSKIALADLSYSSRLSNRDYPVDVVHAA